MNETELWNVALDDERTLSIRHFCSAEDISKDELYALACQGRAPKLTTRYGDFHRVNRIIPEARRNWHKFMTHGFPEHHREEVLQQYFLDDGEEWRERQQERDIRHDDDWGRTIEAKGAEHTGQEQGE